LGDDQVEDYLGEGGNYALRLILVNKFVWVLFWRKSLTLSIAIFSCQEIKKYYCPSKMQENLCSSKSSQCSLTNYGDNWNC
jgi:hypothetical protein